MDFSQYTQENQRVIQGMKDTLKALINKFGGTVDAEKIDQYPTLVDGIEVKGDAGDITYDNAESGLHSNNVQDAIDEVYKAQTSVIPENIVLSDDAELGEPFIADSDTLEGHPASYFAVAEETSAALNQKADLTFSNIVEKTTALENIGAMPKTYTGSDIPVSSEDSTKIKDALGNKADLTLSNLSDYQKALYSIGGRPNRNLLDNWYFVGGGSQKGYGYFPINQNAKTNYTTQQESPLTIDRWCADWHISLDVTDAGLVMSGGGIFQYLENDVINCIQNKQITLSALFQDGSLITATGISSENFGGNGILYATQYGGGYNAVRIIGNAIAAKLEIGDKQTLAYKDSSGTWQLFEKPDYQQTLLQCLSYMIQFGTNAGWGIVQNASTAYILFPLNVPLDMSKGKPILTVDVSQPVWTSKGSTSITQATWNAGLNGYTTLCICFKGRITWVC